MARTLRCKCQVSSTAGAVSRTNSSHLHTCRDVSPTGECLIQEQGSRACFVPMRVLHRRPRQLAQVPLVAQAYARNRLLPLNVHGKQIDFEGGWEITEGYTPSKHCKERPRWKDGTVTTVLRN